MWERGNCRSCRKPVYKGTSAGRFYVLEIKPATTLAVAEHERFHITKQRGLIPLSTARGTVPETCLRIHHCPEHLLTKAGLYLFSEPCSLCGGECWRGELVSRRTVVVNAHPHGEFVSQQLDFPPRQVLTLVIGSVPLGVERFTPHWRLCPGLEQWRDRVRDQVSVRACTGCGQPMAGPLIYTRHPRCVQVPSIYKAARYPFTDPVWAELPGSEYDARPRKSNREQCAALTQAGDQCRLGRDADAEFTIHDARFCCRHNPARHCGRATRINRPCSAYTIDGSACEFHDGMPRMVLGVASESETPAVQEDQDDADVEEIDACENVARDLGAVVPERVEDELLDTTLDPQEVHPRLSTPWPRLNAALQGGFEVGQIVAVSSADHRFASRVLRGLSDHLVKEGRHVERLYCDKRGTTVGEVLEWAELHISSGVEALVLDWFPNILTDAATLEDDWRALSPADILTRLGKKLHSRVASEPIVVFVGACMDPSARADDPGAQVVHYPLHEEASAIEYLARTWLITYPAPTPYKNAVGWLRRAPSDVERVKEPIPLTRS